MLYTVVVAPGSDKTIFWAHATFGNLGLKERSVLTKGSLLLGRQAKADQVP